MDIGAPEILIVLIIVILLFGPSRLANLGGELGRSIREFREGLSGEGKQPPAERSSEAEETQTNEIKPV